MIAVVIIIISKNAKSKKNLKVVKIVFWERQKGKKSEGRG